jgi:hypothetical protein
MAAAAKAKRTDAAPDAAETGAGVAGNGSAPRPEQTFFEDPALDRAFGTVMALATEVWVLKDRVAALEAALAESGVVDPAALDAEPGDEERAARAAERDAYVQHLMESLLGSQLSKGAQ